MKIYKYGATICCRLFFPFKNFAFFAAFHIHLYSETFIIGGSSSGEETHTDVVVLPAICKQVCKHGESPKGSKQNRPCADYGAISVYHLLSSSDEIFIQILLSFSCQCFHPAFCCSLYDPVNSKEQDFILICVKIFSQEKSSSMF